MKKLFAALLTGTLLQAAAPAFADTHKPLFDFADESRWIIRARAISVTPDEDSTVTGLAAGTKAEADYGVAPELDFTYFFTDHIASELILATTRHDMSTNTGVDLGHVWVLPPTLTLQYHFNPKGQFRPYAGAGLGYIFYYGEDKGGVSSIKYKDGISYALQAGMDFGIDEHWAINADVKKLFHNTDVKINGGNIRADVDLDPWVFGVGIAYRF
ncbi:MAG: OmpW family protein [Alphaproteobacteria bacterium]